MRGIVEAGDAMAGDTAQEKRVVVVLAAQPAVIVQGYGQVHLVAGAAELRALVQRFQERPLVQRGLGLDQELVDPAQGRAVRHREWVPFRLPDHVIRIAPDAH